MAPIHEYGIEDFQEFPFFRNSGFRITPHCSNNETQQNGIRKATFHTNGNETHCFMPSCQEEVIQLLISDEAGRIARIKISNGFLTWFPKDQKNGYVLSWKALGEFAVQNGIRKKQSQ